MTSSAPHTTVPEAKEVFVELIGRVPPDQWDARLAELCGGDDVLRRRVEDLLHAHREAGSFLEPAVTSIVIDSALNAVNHPPEPPGTQLGPYTLLQVIGEGGMGVVYLAEQHVPVERRVALKIIKPGMDSRQVIARFEAERQALALMDHPNIARVLDAGTTESARPYFVMELVRGVPITQYCDDRQLSLRQRLELFVPVCQAVQHAHQKGIIHRDLKPSNVLVAEYDGQPVPKIIDFGLAKATAQGPTQQTMFTQYGQVVGTLEYMSPEQAKLNQLDIDTRTDVYSLGVLLYELLAGSTPFDAKRLRKAAFDEMLRIIREEEPARPSTKLSSSESLPSIAAQRHTEPAKLTRLVRGELDWIVMKSLEKERNRRYETASGFARDIERYLADEPVQACPPSSLYRFRKFARRNMAALATASLIGLAVLASVVVLAVSNVRIRQETREKEKALGQARTNFTEAKRQEDIAKKNAKHAAEQTVIAKANATAAKAQEQLAKRRYYAAQMNLAMQAWKAGETPRVLELLEGQRPRPGEEDLRGFEWFYLWRLAYGEDRVPIAGHPTAVLSLSFSHDGKTLASGGHDGTTRLWDAFTGQELETFRAPGTEIWWVAYSPDGRWLATSDRYQRLTIWDAHTRQQRHAIAGGIYGIVFSPDGKYLVGGLADGLNVHVTLWDLDTGRQHAQIMNAGVPLGFLADGSTLVTTSNQHQPTGKVSWWNLETKQELRSRAAPGMNTAAVSSDGTRVAVAVWKTRWKVEVWDAATGDSLVELTEPNVRSLSFAPGSKLLAVGKEDKTVTIWNLETKSPVAHEGHRDHVWATTFSPDGSRLASATLGGAIKVWDFKPAEEATTIRDARPNALQFLADGKALLVGNSGLTKIIDVATGKEVGMLPVSGVSSIAAGANVLARLEPGGHASVWNVPMGRETARISPMAASNPGLTLSSDGGQAATFSSWGRDQTVKVWNLASQQAQTKTFKPKLFAFSPLCVRFSPDGKSLAAGFHFHLLTVWDLASGKIKFEVAQEPFMMNVVSLAFSSDSRMLAVGTDVGSVTLWDVTTGKQVAACRGHALPVRAIAFSHDGKTLVTAGDDHSVKLWDTITGQERSTLSGHTGPVVHVQFTPDGNTLATGSSDGTVKLWRAATDSLALAPRQAVARSEPAAPLKLPSGAVELTEEGLREAVRRWPDQAELARRLGQMLQAADRLADAEIFLDQAVQLEPEHLNGRLALVDVLRRQQKHAPAAEHLQEALRRNPDQAATHQALGWLLWKENNLADAELAFRKAAQLNPSFGGSRYGLGRVLAKQGKHAEAEAEYREAISLGGADPQVHKCLGWALYEQRKFAEAEEPFRQAVQVNPNDAEAHRGLGFLAMKDQKQSAVAEIEFREAIRIDRSHPTAHQMLGWVLVRQQRFTEAEDSFREAIRRNAQVGGAHRGLGMVLLELKRYAEAEASLQTALRLEPENKEAAELLERAKRGSSPVPAKETSP